MGELALLEVEWRDSFVGDHESSGAGNMLLQLFSPVKPLADIDGVCAVAQVHFDNPRAAVMRGGVAKWTLRMLEMNIVTGGGS